MRRGFRTVCRTTTAENGISSCIFNGRYDCARGCDTLYPNSLGFEVSADLFDSYSGVSSAGAGMSSIYVPSRALTAAETDVLQSSQCIGTEKVS